MDIDRTLITNDDGTPVAVQVSYADWMRLEGYLAAVAQATDLPNPLVDATAAEEGAGEASGAGSPDAGFPVGDWTGEHAEFYRRLQEHWESLGGTTGAPHQAAGRAASSPSPSSDADPSSDPGASFEQVLDAARGTWEASGADDDADFEHSLRSEWDDL